MLALGVEPVLHDATSNNPKGTRARFHIPGTLNEIRSHYNWNETDSRAGPSYNSDVPADLHETVAHRLRQAEQRYTNNRRALVDVLSEADRPLTIPELLERRRSLPQSSAYRNLSILEEVGAVRRVVTNDDFARYELAEDLTEHHHHLICSSCGAVEDFTVSKQLEQRLTSAMTSVARRTGFQPTHHRLDLLGSCADCS